MALNSKNIKLSSMMFFQYMMLAVWWIPLAAFLSRMELSRNLTALILSSMAFGSVVSPLVGMLADRYFRGKYVLAFSNLMIAFLLILAGFAAQPIYIFLVLLLAMLFYMPTWAITSAIALANVPSEQFPRIRVFGTLGWILAGAFSILITGKFHVDFDGTHLPFFFGAALAFIAALVNLTLPGNPPMAPEHKPTLLDIMGMRSLIMLRDKKYALFVSLLFFSMIPFTMYWSYFSEYLAYSGYRYITLTMSTGQMSELLIILTVPFFIRKIGLRNTIAIGMMALVIRYLALVLAGNEASLGFVLIGTGIHGVIFGYFHLSGQIYTDKKAPTHLKAQAQGLIFFITFALGLFVGNFICGWIIQLFSATTPGGIVYNWQAIWGISALLSFLVFLSFLWAFRKDYNL